MTRFVGGIVLAAGLLFGLAYLVLLNSDSLQDRLFANLVERRIDGMAREVNAESLSIFICGSGAPLPDPDRAGSCTAIIAGGDIYLVDTGPGSAEVLAASGLDLARVRGVFLTHFHSDHIGDLGEIAMQSWVAGRTGPLPILGPEGVDVVAKGFEQAYLFDEAYRVKHHGQELMPPGAMTLLPYAIEEPRVVIGGLSVTPVVGNHPPIVPAWGYRFDYGGRSVLISGDTLPSENMRQAGVQVDVLVHEALNLDMMNVIADAAAAAGLDRASRLARDTLDYHTSPREAARVAIDAEAGLLVYTHVVPPISNPILEDMFLRGVTDIRPNGVKVAHDGLFIELPTDSKEIKVH